MTRELTSKEDDAAVALCSARYVMDTEGHRIPSNGSCPTCRADVVRLVDAPPLPEIRAEDVAWLKREAAGPTRHAREWVDSEVDELRLAAEHTYKPLAERYARILALLEAVSARKGGGNG